MTLSLDSMIKRAFKYAVGAAPTTDDREAYQEEQYLRRDICSRDVKADSIPTNPHTVIGTAHDSNNGIVYCVRAALSPLTRDGRVWFYPDYSGESWVHPRYDTPFNAGTRTLITSQYQIQIFQTAGGAEGALIPPQASPSWIFDYDTGLLYFSAPPTQLTWPIRIWGYQYAGAYGSGGGDSIRCEEVSGAGCILCLRTDLYMPLGYRADISNPLCRNVIGVTTGAVVDYSVPFRNSGIVTITDDGGLSAGEPAYLGAFDVGTGHTRLARGTGPVLKSLGAYLGSNKLLLNIGPTIIL